MKRYNTEDGWLCKKCRLCEEHWDPLWGPQLPSNMRLKPKLQLPRWICPSPHLHLQCHHSPTDKIVKGRELGVSVILVRARVDSSLLSEQSFWEYDASVAPGCLSSHTVTSNLGMTWTCDSLSWKALAWILEAMGLCKYNSMWSGAFSMFSDSSPSKFCFPAFLKGTKGGMTEPRIYKKSRNCRAAG